MADRQSTKPARGTRDFLPDDVRRREYVVGVVRGVYERYGFEPLETPAFENIETLMGKYGEEGNQLIFKILKRGEHEKSGEADLALRYDLTVPLARVVAEHQNALPALFKRYQIQPVWRADRPARGRFREFYQCDIDATGSTSPIVEAEILGAVSEIQRLRNPAESPRRSDGAARESRRPAAAAWRRAGGARQAR
jgi:histidyl-tRNA synthetase